MKKNKNIEKKKTEILIDHFQAQVKKKVQLGNTRTASNYQSCINKLCVYLGKDNLCFPLHNVTHEWVEGWVNWLMATHPAHPETVDFYFRNTRAMYNLALDSIKDKQSYTLQPFKGIKIKKFQPSKRALSKNEIMKLLAPEFRARLQPLFSESFDILLFILFAQGMVFQDVYNLRWDMVDTEGRIRYTRSKTGSLIEIGVVPEAMEIMERYRQSDSPFVFPFLHRGIKIKSKVISEEAALRRVNQHAILIGRVANLSLPLTTYVMRHTWATLMLESGKQVELISQCLGHSSIRTTQIYLSRISPGKVDVEVNDMFNRMLRSEPSNTLKKKKRNQPVVNMDFPAKSREKQPSIQKKETEVDNINQQSKRVKEETVNGKKKIPFLCKKEKNLNILFLCKKEKTPSNCFDSVIFPSTKISTKTIWTKFATSFFEFIINHKS